MKRALTTLVALGLVAAPLAAQQHPMARPDSAAAGRMAHCSDGMGMGMSGGVGMQMMEGMGQGAMQMPGREAMRRPMHFGARQVLAQREALGLSADQVARIEQLSATPPRMSQHMATVRKAEEDLTRSFDAEVPDTAAVKAAAERLLRLHAAVHTQRIAKAALVRAILTPDQRERALQLPACPMGETGGMMKQEASPSPAPPGGHEEHHPRQPGAGGR